VVVNVYRRALALVEGARRRSRTFDHLWRAQERYGDTYAPRLAAAIAYYGFFAAFALSLVAFSILGYVLAGQGAAVGSASAYLHNNLPFLHVEDIRNARQAVAVLSFLGLVLAGVGWVDAMRSSQRAIWRLEQQPGQPVIRRLIDLGMLIGLGLLVALSLSASNGIEDLAPRSAVRWLGPVLSTLVNLAVAAWLLVAVPRVRVSPRRMAAPVVLVGLGVTLLNALGRLVADHTANNPAYRVAGAAAGLLVFLNLFSQLLLFGAALAATSRDGVDRDPDVSGARVGA
jgi:membrane protein